MKCYDWETNKLYIETISGVKFDIQMRGYKTIVGGNSATGKTFLCSTIADYKKAEDSGVNISSFDVSDIVLLTRENKGLIGKTERKLFIIDRADMFITDEDVNRMNKDINTNRYLIFARKPMALYITPNYYGEFVATDDNISLKYLFNVRGWF